MLGEYILENYWQISTSFFVTCHSFWYLYAHLNYHHHNKEALGCDYLGFLDVYSASKA